MNDHYARIFHDQKTSDLYAEAADSLRAAQAGPGRAQSPAWLAALDRHRARLVGVASVVTLVLLALGLRV